MSKIIPVIHCTNRTQIRFNLDICNRNNIEMVFLINHNSGENSTEDLVEYFRMAKSEFPNMKIGLNFLQLNTSESIKKCNEIGNVDAIWSDYEYPIDPIMSNQIYFGAVAFKYQKHVPNDMLEDVCKKAMGHMDVVTTSGTATGSPANINKIKMIRDYIGNHKLAIASGITSQNKSLYEPYVDYMLVASSITDSSEKIIESKLIELIK